MNLKQSVSVAISHPEDHERVLIVKRPADDEELPNVWGLPAASLGAGESFEDAVRRAGREKLGVQLEPIAELNRGSVQRFRYELAMRLYSARIVSGEVSVPQGRPDVTQYQEWKWGTSTDLLPAADRGSLCCRLFLQSIGREKR